ncbi:MAG: PQQ-dependent sugar dehydrogenase [Flavobacteriales bacterium]|nr:PQQ-dependent sugar dehydrogenase [Flavobacteriales bacterium]
MLLPALLGALAAVAQPPDFTVTTIASGINAPTTAAFLPDGRILVGQKDGLIRISTTPVAQAPVTLATYMVLPVDNSAEHGLVGLWISPYFATDSAVFVYRSTDGQRNRLSTFKHLGSSALPSSEPLIWETPVYTGCCHTGGAFAFLPDTTILLAVGDDHTLRTRRTWPAPSASFTASGGTAVRPMTTPSPTPHRGR